jgi:hypothetical protein
MAGATTAACGLVQLLAALDKTALFQIEFCGLL